MPERTGMDARTRGPRSYSGMLSHGPRALGVSVSVVAALLAILVFGVATAAAERETGAPLNTVAPVVSGTPAEGKKVKAVRGTWTGASPFRYTDAWSLCSATGTECKAIPGASKTSYKPVNGDVGHRLKVTIKASNKDGVTEATSGPSAIVGPAPPKRKKPPTITGEAVDGRILTVGEGTWKGSTPLTFTYQWEHCKGRVCQLISGANEKTYRARTADIGLKLRTLVVAHNGAGEATAKSKASAKVVPGSPLNLAPPSISGIVLPGQQLTANNGTWVGTPPITYAYQWLSCPALGGGCSQIPGATESTYTVGSGEIGDAFEVVVTATNAQGKASATSPETGITGGGVQPPEVIVAPAIIGLAVTGQTLTATEGLWKGTEPKYAFQWELCNGSGASCEPISGAKESKYTIPDGEAGSTLRVTVTASNSAGNASSTSEATTQILGVGPVNVEAPTVSGTATAGQILTAASGKWTGTEPILYEYEWLRCDTSGSECTTAQAPSPLPIYVVAGADVGHTLRVEVIAKNIAGTGTAESAPTSTVAGVAPENLVAPLVLGLSITGQTLTATEGTWKGTEPFSYSFQWQLCSKSGTGCEDIAGATKSTFTIPDGDAGHTLVVVVTAKNVAGSASKASAATTEVLGVGPKNTEAPTVSGTATAGQILTAASGKWTGTEPILYEYEWLRCNTAGAECVTAQAPSALPIYTVAGADVGHRLKAKVIAKNIAGSGTAESAATAEVGGVAPENILAPTVVGLSITGQTLTATEGTWKGTEPFSYSFQWQLCSKSGTGCEDIAGATKSTFVIPDGDAGHTLVVVVTAKNVAGSVSKASSATPEVLGVGPKNTEAPTVSGTATAGQTLTAASGKWTGTEPILYEYEWLRCNTAGAECTTAAGASILATYTVVGADVGHKLKAKVIAKNIAGSAAAESAATAEVGGVAPENILAPTIVGLAVTGQTLTATEGTWKGTEPISYSFQWQLCSKSGTGCENIAGATKSTFVIPDGDAAHTLVVVVTAKNVAGSVSKASAATSEVLGVGPKNTEPPTVTGTAIAGQTLTGASGKWTGTEPILYEYEWLRCNSAGAACTTAAVASILTNYTVVPADVGHRMKVKVIAKNLAGTATAESAATAEVTGVLPKNTIAPLIVGAPVSGIADTATEGTWEGTAPITYSFQWVHCAGSTCTDISGATKNTFTPAPTEIGKTLKVKVTAKNVAGSVTVESAATIPIIL